MDWLKVSLILCSYGFFRSLRPSEPYLTDFLSGEWRNVTSEQLNREVFPVSTYSYLTQLIVIFLVTDMLRYKPIIIISSMVGITIWSLLLWTKSLFELQVIEVLYGTFAAAEVAYFVYIYAKVDREKYQQVTSHTRSAYLAGSFLAGVLGQVLVSTEIMDIRQLNYISLAAQVVTLSISIWLPPVKTSLYFYTQTKGLQDEETDVVVLKKNAFSFNHAIHLLWTHFRAAFSNPTVIKWSIWWAIATCGYLMVLYYSQLLWQVIDPHRDSNYNGAVEALHMLCGSLAAFSAGFLSTQQVERFSFLILTLGSLILGGCLLAAAWSHSVWVAYSAHVLIGALYNFMITVASAMIARRLLEDSFALVFGINTFFALALQTVLTIVVISDHGLVLQPRDQFFAFGVYFLGLSVVYGAVGSVSRYFCRKKIDK